MEQYVRRLGGLLILIILASATPAWAQSSQPAAKEEPSIYDKVWRRFTTWHDDKENPVVQRVLFTGRYQHDFATVDADQGETDEWNVRRMRLGTRVTMFRNYTVHVEADVNPQEHDPFYLRLTDAYVMWTRNPQLALTVGKQSVPFTLDGATSSRDLITIDRNNLSNNLWFTQEYIPGVSVSGRASQWNYRGGVYSAGSSNREFGEFTGGLFTLAAVGYDFSKRLGVKEAALTGNYVYQNPDPDNTFTRRLQHISSVYFRLEQGRFGFRTDVSAATGYSGQPNLWGYVLMPYVNLTDKLQLAGRYTLVHSDGPNGVSLNTYENRVSRGTGDEYNEGYIGASYYFYGNRLKLQTGVQFADMQDRANDGGAYSGTSWTTGLRVGW